MTVTSSIVARRRPPPVEYAVIRRRYQQVRLLGATLIACLALVAFVQGETFAATKAVAAGALAIDAAIRLHRGGGPIGSLIVDAVAIVLFAGAADHFDAELAAGLAYLVVAALTLLELRLATAILAIAGAGAAARVVIAHGTVDHVVSPALEWVEAGVFLTAVVGVLLAAVRAIAIARSSQEDALLTERRASEIRADFVSMITHELRTPLTTISGFLMTLQDSWADLGPEEIDEFLSIMTSESEHLQTLVDDVLTIPRLESGHLLLDITDFPLQPSAYRIADLIFPAGGERTASVSVAGSVMVHADPNRVEQVLRNLLENARKYGGDEVSVEANLVDGQYQVVVADNGPGVPEQQREAIFEAFQQATSGDARTDQGFGLGLAITRKLVEAMGGTVHYEPGFPVGSRFCFTLPAARVTPGLPVASPETADA